MSTSIWLLGAGNMGGAMLRGWLGQGMDAGAITVIDPYVDAVPEGVTHWPALPANAVAPEVLVLAIKPQTLGEARAAFRAQGVRPRLLISVLAGVEIATLAEAFAPRQIVRAMPNLPASIGQGVTVLCAPDADAALREEAGALMAPLGVVEWILREDLFHAVTALSGSGPGFVFRFIEALAEAGTALGLPADQAERLALRTVEGAGLLAAQSPETPARLADRVASPGGTTRAGLDVLDADAAMKRLIADTLDAAAKRSAEMAAVARG